MNGILVAFASSYDLALLGGVLIGLGVTGLLYSHGRLAGISGILAGVLEPKARHVDWSWRAAFLLGLMSSGVALGQLRPELFTALSSHGALPVLAVAGLLAGFGARLSGGCTSGHGICGIGSLSLRSLAATCTFMLVGALTVLAARTLLSGAP